MTPLEKYCHLFSAAIALVVLLFMFHDARWDGYLLYNVPAFTFALYTALFVRNKFFNILIILMIFYVSYEILVHSSYIKGNKTPTQVKNEAVIVGVFVYSGWLLTIIYFLWTFLKRLNERSIAISAKLKSADGK